MAKTPNTRRTPRTALSFEGAVSVTQQSFRDECDINLIAKRFNGAVPPPVGPVGTYADFASVPDFHEAQNTILRAREQFASLPVHVRTRFNNDPVQLLAFVADRGNLAEAHKLGLLSQEASASFEASLPKPVVPCTLR